MTLLAAHPALLAADRYRWLADLLAMEEGVRKSFQPELLAALGRILIQDGDDDLYFWCAVDWLCQHKPKVKRGLFVLRVWRKGGH